MPPCSCHWVCPQQRCTCPGPSPQGSRGEGRGLFHHGRTTPRACHYCAHVTLFHLPLTNQQGNRECFAGSELEVKDAQCSTPAMLMNSSQLTVPLRSSSASGKHRPPQVEHFTTSHNDSNTHGDKASPLLLVVGSASLTSEELQEHCPGPGLPLLPLAVHNT